MLLLLLICYVRILQLSLASVAVDQVFTKVGRYRGTIVRTKDLVFSKRHEIGRKTMKEMRLMREIRHDNINPFIGAAVEPSRIQIVSEYCHKGSLPVCIFFLIFQMMQSSINQCLTSHAAKER